MVFQRGRSIRVVYREIQEYTSSVYLDWLLR